MYTNIQKQETGHIDRFPQLLSKKLLSLSIDFELQPLHITLELKATY